MPEQVERDQAQRTEALHTPFRGHIEAALQERGLQLIADPVFEAEGLLTHGAHSIGTLIYVVAPAEFTTIRETNERITSLRGLDSAHFTDEPPHGDYFRAVQVMNYNNGVPQDELRGIDPAQMDLYEPTGSTSFTTQAVPQPLAGMQALYEATGVTASDETKVLPQFLRHRIIAFPDLEIAQAIVEHFLNPLDAHHETELFEHARHSHGRFSHSVDIRVPFEAFDDAHVRRLLELPPLTGFGAFRRTMKTIAVELGGAHSHHH